MNQREKLLVIGVSSALVLAGGQYLFSKYKAAVSARMTRIASLDRQIFEASDKRLQGALADRQMGDYMVRSLPSNQEKALAAYRSWLFETMGLVDMRDGSVSFINAMPVGDLYDRYAFKLTGKTDPRGWLELLHTFYSRDYLHRITEMTVAPAREGGLQVNLSIDVIALKAAAEDLPPPASVSPLVGNYQDYADSILNRNFFSGPNQSPKFTGSDRLATEVGRSSTVSIPAEDAEKQRLIFELVGPAPEGLQLDQRTGAIRWMPETKGTFDLEVKVTDDGYPPQSAQRRFQLAVVDPPPPPPTTEKPGFDDATQTVLTALVQGRDDWTAWMKVRTRGTTLKLKPGDQFEIGKLKGSVVAVNSKFVTLEINGNQFELRPSGVLADAAKTAKPAEK